MTGMSDLELARQIKNWSAGPLDPEVITASMAGRLHEEIGQVFPEAKRRFGAGVLHAATRKVAPGTCRFCIADANARVHLKSLPRISAATRELLGMPCRKCLARRVHAADRAGGRAGESRRSVGRGVRLPSDVTSSVGRAPLRRPHDPKAPCATCTQARGAVRAAKCERGLTASAAVASDANVAKLVQAALAPHSPRLAPAGRIAPIIHNGRGAQANCTCRECRGARIIAFADRTSV